MENNNTLVPQEEVVVEAGSRIVNDTFSMINTKGLTPIERSRYGEITKSLNEKDITSINSYGSDLSRAMDSYSSEFLTQQMNNKNSIESAALISNLLGELQQVDIADLEAPGPWKRFMRNVPVLRNFVTSIDKIANKYNTMQENIDKIRGKLQATKEIAYRDNSLLQKQFENNLDYIKQLEDLIIAGKIKSEELDSTIQEMITAQNASNRYEDYEISDVQEYKNALDKRLTDLITLRYTFKQSLAQIRIIQRTNMMDANNTDQQITMVIPLWKNQLSIAVSLYNQQQSLEVKDKVTNATNEILKKNSEMMKSQAIKVVEQNQRSVIDIETLRKTTNDLMETIISVQKAQQEGAQKRLAAEQEIAKLEHNMYLQSTGIKESQQRIVAKELQGVEIK